MVFRTVRAALPRAVVVAFSFFGLSFLGFGTFEAVAAPYQATAGADCGASTNCIVKFPAVPAASRLEVQFVACEIRSGAYGESANTVSSVRFELQTSQNGKTVSLDLVSLFGGSQYDGTKSYSAISQPVVFPVSGQQSLSIVAWESTGSSLAPVDRMDCTVNGTLEDAATAAPVLMTAHAQCPSGTDCVVHFPTSATALKATFAACSIYSATSEATSASTRFYLQTIQNGKPIGFPLGSVEGGVEETLTYPFPTYSEVSQPVSFLVPANQVLKLFAWPDSGRYIDRMDCTVAAENLP